MTYYELKIKHQREMEDFPIQYAFNIVQFMEGMKELGLKPFEIYKVQFIGNGGFIRKSDKELYEEMLDRHAKEMENAIASEKTGNEFISSMFSYEMINQKYYVTYNTEDTLKALHLTMDDIFNDGRLLNGLQKSLANIQERYILN